MKRKVMFLAGTTIAILLVSLACVAPADSATAPPVDNIAHISDITALQTTKADKTEIYTQAQVNTQIAIAIDNFKSTLPAQTTTPTNVYTQAEVDAQIAAAIAALKNDQSWITASTTSNPSGSGSPASSGAYGTLMAYDEDIQLWMEKVTCGDSIHTRQNKTSECRFDMIVRNLDNQTHDFLIDLKLTPKDNDVVLDMSSNATFLDSSGNLDFLSSRSPNSDRKRLLFEQDDDEWINSHDDEGYSLWLEMYQTSAEKTRWEYNFSIEQTD